MILLGEARKYGPHKGTVRMLLLHVIFQEAMIGESISLLLRSSITRTERTRQINTTANTIDILGMLLLQVCLKSCEVESFIAARTKIRIRLGSALDKVGYFVWFARMTGFYMI